MILQNLIPMRRALYAIIWLSLLAGGCGGQSGGKAPQQLDLEAYGALPGLRATPNQQLRDELARIIEEGGTPELLSRATLPGRRQSIAPR